MSGFFGKAGKSTTPIKKSSSSGGLLSNFSLKDGLIGGLVASSIVRGLPTRALASAIGIAFSDDIEAWVTSQTGKRQLGEMAERAVIGGSFGLLLGRRFGLIGAAIGALATDENKALLTETGTKLRENWNDMSKTLEPYLGFLPSFEGIVTFLATTTTEGLKGINGFLDSGFSSEVFKKNWPAALAVLGTTAAVLMPKKLFGVITTLAKFRGGKLFAALSAFLGTKLALSEQDLDDSTETILALGAGATAAAGLAATTKLTKGAKPRPSQRISPGLEPKAKSLNTVYQTKTGRNYIISENAKGQRYSSFVSKNLKAGDTINPKTLKAVNRLTSSMNALRKAAKGPLLPLYAALQTGNAIGVASDPQLSDTEKTNQIAAIIGDTIGMSLGTVAGATLGSALGPAGGFIGALLGAGLGSFGGKSVATWVAKALLGIDDAELTQAQKNLSAQLQQGMGGGMYNSSNKEALMQARQNAMNGVSPSVNQSVVNSGSYGSASSGSSGNMVGNDLSTTNVTNNNNTNLLGAGTVVVFDNGDMLVGDAF